MNGTAHISPCHVRDFWHACKKAVNFQHLQENHRERTAPNQLALKKKPILELGAWRLPLKREKHQLILNGDIS